MQRQPWIFFFAVFMVSGTLGLANANPKLPDSEWEVHDRKRPKPPAVKTEGAVVVPPPSDAIILFDGKSADAWENPDNGKTWAIKDGAMVAGPVGDVQSKEHFGDFQLHLEWRLPRDRKVSGQKGGNSGIFMPGGYEIQILQSHNNPTYADGYAGALYGQRPPRVNATSPQGTWQSYDIFFEAARVDEAGKLREPARVTVIHNGVLLHHRREFIGPTQWRKVARYPEKPTTRGPLRLQWHKDPMEFRNIWIRKLDEDS